MRALFSCTAIALFLSFSAISALAQNPGEIIDQYLKAAGGLKALSKVTTVSMEGTFFSERDGATGTYTFDTKAPNRYYTELDIVSEPGSTDGRDGAVARARVQHFILAYNGKSAWREDPAGSVSTLLGTDGQQVIAAAEYYNSHWIGLKKKGIGVAFMGRSNWGTRDVIQLELTTPAGIKREAYFDGQTHLLLKESAQLAGVNLEIIYDDYRKVDGVELPYKIEWHYGSESYVIEVSRAAINDDVREEVFNFPRNVQVPVTDLKSLFKEIADNQRAIEKIKEKYGGTRDEEQAELDGSGKVKSRTVNEYTFFYMDGEEISTLVKKNGSALSDSDQRKENEKAQKEIENAQKRATKKEAKEEKAAEEGQEDKEDHPGIEIFLRASQFKNPRRERFRGQDVLVFDFEPSPEFKPHKMAEDIVHNLAGVIWIDERAHQVARLEAYFVGDFRIGGGVLANLQKGTTLIFEQAYLNNEVWLPTYVEAHVKARVLLLKGLKENAVIRYSDYKKFNTNVIPTVVAPKQ
ncbi:MAG TPA: hypothetical protein VKR82_14110 [Candidatus Acidoferrales bacterium]|nr:hypothetical protein [Candidatus Acidoferrales bacterium]